VFANKAKIINFLLQKLESWAFCGFNQPLASKPNFRNLKKMGILHFHQTIQFA